MLHTLLVNALVYPSISSNLVTLATLSPKSDSVYTVTSRGKGGTMRARTHRQVRTLPNPEALGAEIEEGVVNRRPLQLLFPLPRGGARPSAGPGAILLQSTNYARVVISSEN